LFKLLKKMESEKINMSLDEIIKNNKIEEKKNSILYKYPFVFIKNKIFPLKY